jgi:hypothetical protein
MRFAISGYLPKSKRTTAAAACAIKAARVQSQSFLVLMPGQGSERSGSGGGSRGALFSGSMFAGYLAALYVASAVAIQAALIAPGSCSQSGIGSPMKFLKLVAVP